MNTSKLKNFQSRINKRIKDELNIEVTPVKTVEDMIISKSFSATIISKEPIKIMLR